MACRTAARTARLNREIEATPESSLRQSARESSGAEPRRGPTAPGRAASIATDEPFGDDLAVFDGDALRVAHALAGIVVQSNGDVLAGDA